MFKRSILSLLLLISCTPNKGKQLETQLLAGKYWDIVYENGAVIYGYKFYPPNKVSYYYYNHFNGKREKYFSEDEIFDSTWHVTNDASMITIRGMNREMLKFENDTLLLGNIVNDSKLLLVKSKQK